MDVGNGDDGRASDGASGAKSSAECSVDAVAGVRDRLQFVSCGECELQEHKLTVIEALLMH